MTFSTMNLCLSNPEKIKKYYNAIITLILKVKQPSTIGNFRYFILCNVLYRIFSKILACRLKKCIEKLVSLYQNVFLKSRQIFDNSIIVNEIMNNLRKNV